nr:uncharacterized protein BN887_05468 [Melanopsichium pennsylvanicum 4]
MSDSPVPPLLQALFPAEPKLRQQLLFTWSPTLTPLPPLSQANMSGQLVAVAHLDKIIIPDWSFEAGEAEWKQVWDWQVKGNILASEPQSDVYLFLQRRTWLAQKPQQQWRLTSYATLEDTTLAPREEFFNAPRRESANITQELPAEAPTADAYEIEHVLGVAPCMLCAGPKDSAAHGFVESEQANKAWKSIMPTLRKMVNGPSVPLDLRNIVLGWPNIKCPVRLRARLLLWRDTAIHLMVKRRKVAITLGLENDHNPRLEFINFAADHGALVCKTISDAYDKCAISKRTAFAQRWVEGGTLLREVGGTLNFHLMSNNASTAHNTTTAMASTSASTATVQIP